MSWFGGNEKVAIGIGARRVRLLVGRGNGHVKVLFAGSRALPEGAIRVGLRAPGLLERDAVLGALRELVLEARGAGTLKRAPETTALLLADGVFKLATAPLEGKAPASADGARMARWMLRELVPVEADEIRADWAVIESTSDETAVSTMVSVGGVEALLSEYEALVRELGWTVGRLVPWSFAAAAARDAGDGDGAAPRALVLCDADGAAGAVFESGGVPRMHRAWRKSIAGTALAEELPGLRRYLNDHLETTISGVWLCGDDDWTRAAADACALLEIPAHVLTPEAALQAAIEG